MCGITAVFSRRSDVSDATMRAGTAALYHRGPDGQQHWISPDHRVGLGHARLSIIDLTTGDQPIANEDGSLVIVHNGEFYDFERIRAGLEARGHRFRTRSDSEVALHLYEELGPECLHQLRGEFTFVIWDARNQRLFAARDRFGVKPLFYAHQGDALYLASEAKALFAMGVDAAWSHESVFAGGFVIPGERTLFRGVYTVPPGHFMRATHEGFRLQQYWDVDYPRDDAAPPPRSDREYIEGFRGVLEEAVKTRLRADGRKVVLTGEGSDEILAGYPHFRRDMLLHHTDGQSPEEVARLMAQLVATNQVSRGLLMPEGESVIERSAAAVLEFVPSWMEAIGGGATRMHGLMNDDFVAAQGGVDVVGSFLASIDVKRRLAGRNAVHSALYLWAKTALPHYILSNLGDRMEMGHSVEGRVAFMDHHVAEYLHNVPVSLKIRGMTEKYILREAVRDVITPTVYARQKHPFLSPPSTHHPDAPLHQLMQDTLRSAAARDVPFLDQAKLIATLDSVSRDDPGAAAVTDLALTVCTSYVFMHEGLGLSS